MSAAVPALDADLVAGLRRLKLAKVRRMAPEVLHTAKVQRWSPEEVLLTLVEAEIAARDESNHRTRSKVAGFPVHKTLDEFKVAQSSVPQATFDYVASLEWIRAAENLCLIGPAGTGKSHLLVGAGHAAVANGCRVRYFTAADLVETLYRGLADNSVGKLIDSLLRSDLIVIDELGLHRSMLWGHSCSSASSPRRTSGAVWALPAIGPSTNGAPSCPSTPPPSPCSTASCTTPWSWYRGRIVPHERGEVARRWSLSEDLTLAPSWPEVRISGWPQLRTSGWPLTGGRILRQTVPNSLKG